MIDKTNSPDAPHRETQPNGLERSDPQMIFDGLTALGVAAGGFGTLGIGAAKVKDAFGGGDAKPTDASPPEPKQSD